MECSPFGAAPSYGRQRAIGKALAAVLALLLLALPARAGITIAALGDSLTQGYGLPPEQGLVPTLGHWLQARGEEVDLINAGVSGDTTAGGRARVDWTLTPEVDAMIVALGGNDMLRAIDPGVTRANLDAILAAAEEKGIEVLLVGLEAPGNYGPAYKREFDSIFPELAEKYGTLLQESLFEGIAKEGPGAAARFMQPDGIHPNAEGVRRIVRALGPDVRALIDRTGGG